MRQFFHNLKSCLCGRNKSRASAAHRPSVRPEMEALEDRLVPAIAYHGGQILNDVYVEAVYYGHAWTVDPAMQKERQQMDAFLKDVVKSPLMDAMKEYYMNDPYYGKEYVGKGTFLFDDVVDATFRTDYTGTQVVDDAAIQSMLQQEIQNGHLYGQGDLIMVFTPSSVVTVSNGGNSVYNYLKELAHHTYYNDPWGGPTPYAIVPNPIGNPNSYWNATTTDLQRLTGAASHEFEEAVTDPYLDAWYDSTPPATGVTEIGDYTTYYKPYASTAQKGSPGVFGPTQQYSLLNGYVVQNVWSASANNTVALPQTVADYAGDSFTFHYGSSSSAVGVLKIQSEDPSTGAFSGSYHNNIFGGWIPISGQLSNTTTNSGTLSSSISFAGSGYNWPFYETVNYWGTVTGNGNAASTKSDVMDGTLVDYVYYAPNSYQLWWAYGGPSRATDY
jgi:hypothetical protein